MNRIVRNALVLLPLTVLLTALVAGACANDVRPTPPSTPGVDGAPGGGNGNGNSGGGGGGNIGGGGGSNGGGGGNNGGGATTPPAPVMATATRDTVVWKRQRAVEHDLMRALALSKDDVCTEVGTFSCVDAAHLAALGGNEPFELTQYVPVPSPTVTTPFALERVVLSACDRRAELDAQAQPAQRAVFTAFDLTPGAVVSDAALDALGTTLYRRLLARDPLPEELAALRPLRDDDTAALDVAKLACFAVGTSIEFAFE